jgi:tetratricopeptide (TPR) repeat protein
VEHRYLPAVELKRTAHLRVADYFAVQPEGPRRIEELPWQLAEAAEWDRLVALLTDPSFFMAAWDVREYDVKRYWVQTEAGSAHRMVDAYQPVIREPEMVPLSFLHLLFQLLYQSGHLDEASSMGDCMIQASRKYGNKEELEAFLGNQALILKIRGNLDGSLTLLEEQERICREIKNINGLVISLGNQANILYAQGNIKGSMALHKQEEWICRELKDDNGLQASLGNQAVILKGSGDLDGAMALNKKKEQICQELGNVDGLQRSLGNQATILFVRGDLDGAMALNKKKEQICRELGNVDGLQISLGNQALILCSRGDLDGAMGIIKDVEKIYRELGNTEKLATSLASQARILSQQNRHPEALSAVEEAHYLASSHGYTVLAQKILGIWEKIKGEIEVVTDRKFTPEQMNALFCSPSFIKQIDNLGAKTVLSEATDELISIWLKEGFKNWEKMKNRR